MSYEAVPDPGEAMIVSKENSIEVIDVHKDFRFGFKRTSLVRSLQEYFKRENDKHQTIHALRGINFSVKKGETFGILGPNASGKTTLLKLIAGILKPTSGEVKINGDIIAFLQLGLGFQDELTALENVYLYAGFLGMDKRQVYDKLGNIIEFSELGNFLNMKLKYFSTGMRARLAFSVVIQTKTDIILLDEFLAVGDIYFQKKCFQVLEGFKQQGKTIIFVSQALGNIGRICTRALLLDKGKQILEGDIDSAVEKYKTLYK